MLKVGVLLGGKSIEREVSFNSGRTVCDHLDTKYFQAIPIFQRANGDLYILPWSFLYRGKIVDFEHRLEKEAQKIVWDDLPSLIDFMYIAVHGKFAEDGRLQATLELFKIPYLGAKRFGSALAMNKTLHNQFLQKHVDVPQGFSLTVSQIKSYKVKQVDSLLNQHKLVFPLVVKPAHEGSSFGVFVVHDKEALLKAMQAACFIAGSKGQEVLIEEKIEGMEFACIIITDHKTGKLFPLPPTEVMLPKGAQIFDYEQKYMPGKAIENTPASCSKADIKKIQDTCVKAMKALHFSNMARIDGFLTKDGRVVIIDSNPLSGMAPATFLFRQAGEAGIGHAELINCLIKAELKNYKMEKQVSSTKKVVKTKVAVLFGGPSHEREISLESGRNVCYKLSPEKYDVTPIFVDQDMKLYVLDKKLLVNASTREISKNIKGVKPLPWSDLKGLVDFVFLGLHGGPGENGVVQGTLEMLGVPYNGSSVFASALCMDKYKTGQFLKQHGFAVPNAFLLSKDAWKKSGVNCSVLQSYIKNVVFPCVVKPHDDGCSVMVEIAHNEEELYQSLQKVLKEKDSVLIEEKIRGMELTVGVVGNENPRSLTPSEAISKSEILSIEEKFLPGAGENQTPARLSQKDITFVQQELVRVYKALNCAGYARIDCFFQNEKQSGTGKKQLVILECNSLPGLTPATCLFHQAAEEGLRPMDLLDEIIQLGMQAHKQDDIVSVDEVLSRQQEFEKSFLK